MSAFRIFSRFADLIDINVTRAAAAWLRLNADGSVTERTAAQTLADVGGVASSGGRFGTPTTADALSDVMIATSAISQRGLTIQAKSGQTGSMLRLAEHTNGTANNGWDFTLSDVTVSQSGNRTYFSASVLLMIPTFLIRWNSVANNPFSEGTLGITPTSAGSGILEVNNGTLGTLRDIKLRSAIQSPPASITPATNGDLVFEATSNTSLTVKLKGTDGWVRSVVLTLAP